MLFRPKKLGLTQLHGQVKFTLSPHRKDICKPLIYTRLFQWNQAESLLFKTELSMDRVMEGNISLFLGAFVLPTATAFPIPIALSHLSHVFPKPVLKEQDGSELSLPAGAFCILS